MKELFNPFHLAQPPPTNHQRQFPLDADGCGDLLGNGLLDDLGGHHPACFLLEDIRE